MPYWVPHLAGYKSFVATCYWISRWREHFDHSWHWFRANWRDIERSIITIAAVLALFPLYTYWDEQDERRLERTVQEAQLLAHCLDVELSFSEQAEALDSLRNEIMSQPNWEQSVLARDFIVEEAQINRIVLSATAKLGVACAPHTRHAEAFTLEQQRALIVLKGQTPICGASIDGSVGCVGDD